MADADTITIGAGTCTSTAAIAEGFGTNGDKITVASGATLNISAYDDKNFAGLTNNGTVNVTTAAGAVLESAKLPSVTSIIVAVNSGNCTAANVCSSSIQWYRC